MALADLLVTAGMTGGVHHERCHLDPAIGFALKAKYEKYIVTGQYKERAQNKI